MGSSSTLNLGKEVRELVRYAETLGYEASLTNGGHVAFTHPLVEKPIFGPATPSDYRSLKNTKALLKREARRGEDELTSAVQAGRTGPDGSFYVDCPACLKRGEKKGFASAEALAWHLAGDHQPPTDLEPEPEQEEQKVEAATTEAAEQSATDNDYYPRSTADLENWLAENFEPGEVVYRDKVVGQLGSGVKNPIETLRQRGAKSVNGRPHFKLRTRLLPHSHGAYRYAPPMWDPDEPQQQKDSSGPTKDPGTENGRVFEVVNQFVDGRFLVRDEGGDLFMAEMKPL